MPPFRGEVPLSHPPNYNPYTPAQQTQLHVMRQNLRSEITSITFNSRYLELPSNIGSRDANYVYNWLRTRVYKLLSVVAVAREILLMRNICLPKDDAQPHRPFCEQYDSILQGLTYIQNVGLRTEAITHAETLQIATMCFGNMLGYLMHFYEHHTNGDDHDYYQTQGAIQNSLDILTEITLVFGHFYKLAYELGALRPTDVQEMDELAHLGYAAAGIQPPEVKLQLMPGYGIDINTLYQLPSPLLEGPSP